MKNYIISLFFIGSSIFNLFAQAPQAFNYQAQVRDGSGELIIDTNVSFRFGIKQGSPTAAPVFIETHVVATDDIGQVSLSIGQGTPSLGVFSEIDWSLGEYYLDVELDIGNGFLAMGVTQFLSVPYALYAENAGNSETPSLEQVLVIGNSANNLKITSLLDPTDNQDAATKAYVDTQAQEAIQNLSRVLLEGNDADGIAIMGLPAPIEPEDAANKQYVDDEIAGATQSLVQVLNQGNNAEEIIITGLPLPTEPSDAANKEYVDLINTNQDLIGGDPNFNEYIELYPTSSVVPFLSGDGKKLMIDGYVKDLTTNPPTNFAEAISGQLNYDGTKIISGNNGLIEIYSLDGGIYTLNSTLNLPLQNSIRFNIAKNDSLIVASSAQQGNTSQTTFFKLTANNVWQADGGFLGVFNGNANSDATLVALVETASTNGFTNNGTIKVMEYNNGSVNQKGATINGLASNENIGNGAYQNGVDISDDGNTIAFNKFISRSPGGQTQTDIRVLEYISAINSWAQKGNDITNPWGITSGYFASTSPVYELSEDGNEIWIAQKFTQYTVQNTSPPYNRFFACKYVYENFAWRRSFMIQLFQDDMGTIIPTMRNKTLLVDENRSPWSRYFIKQLE